ncbi:MAG: substrate-binding domain-containing protein [Bacteriovorax sp.]|nr:substrate-binding domain-containing protein [Bacteriovorax sp.]
MKIKNKIFLNINLNLILGAVLIYSISGLKAEEQNKSPSQQERVLRTITGKPIVDSPQLLDWSSEYEASTMDMSDSNVNMLHDFHGDINDCEMALTTYGNYHSALTEIWSKYLNLFPKNDPLKNWFYFAGGPAIEEQISLGFIQVGSFKVRCQPQIAIIGMREFQKLKTKGLIVGEAIPFIGQREFVILVKKGNPKKIKTVFDLARPDVSFITSSPIKETSSFVLTVRILYKMAQLEKPTKKDISAIDLINRIFNTRNDKKKVKWLVVKNFTHRAVPWSIAYGRGDAAILPSHMATNIKKQFADLFDIVHLKNGEVNKLFSDTKSGNLYISHFNGNWSTRQKEAQAKLVTLLLSDEVSQILSRYDVDRVNE